MRVEDQNVYCEFLSSRYYKEAVLKYSQLYGCLNKTQATTTQTCMLAWMRQSSSAPPIKDTVANEFQERENE